MNRDIGNIKEPDTEKSSGLNGRKRQKSKWFMMESNLKTPFQKKQVCIKLLLVAVFLVTESDITMPDGYHLKTHYCLKRYQKF